MAGGHSERYDFFLSRLGSGRNQQFDQARSSVASGRCGQSLFSRGESSGGSRFRWDCSIRSNMAIGR
jgi:hypothetical protein